MEIYYKNYYRTLSADIDALFYMSGSSNYIRIISNVLWICLCGCLVYKIAQFIYKSKMTRRLKYDRLPYNQVVNSNPDPT